MTRNPLCLSRLATLLLAAGAAACSRDSAKGSEPTAASPPTSSAMPEAAPAAAPMAPAPASAGSLSPKSTVKLLEPGREPRRALRYAFHADQRERMAIELSTTVSAEGGGSHRDVALAPLEIAIALEPKSVWENGDLGFAWHVESATLGALDAASPPEVAQGWNAQLLPVQHLSGTGMVSSHGVSRGVVLDPGTAGEAGPDSEMVVQVLQMLRDVAAPLPDEPVGPGARWQKISTLDAKNGHATQTDTYTLSDLQGSTGTLGDVLAQTASPQSLRTAGVDGGGGTAAQMDQLLTSGTAKVRFDLARVVPQTTLDGTTSMALSGASNRMNMVMHLGIVVRGTVP